MYRNVYICLPLFLLSENIREKNLSEIVREYLSENIRENLRENIRENLIKNIRENLSEYSMLASIWIYYIPHSLSLNVHFLFISLCGFFFTDGS